MISCQKRYRYIDIEISKQYGLKFFDSNYIHCHIDKPWQVVHKYMGTEIEAIYQNIFIWQIYVFQTLKTQLKLKPFN